MSRSSILVAAIGLGALVALLLVSSVAVAQTSGNVDLTRPGVGDEIGGDLVTVEWWTHTNDTLITGRNCDFIAFYDGDQTTIREDETCDTSGSTQDDFDWLASEVDAAFPDVETAHDDPNDRVTIQVFYNTSTDAATVDDDTVRVEYDSKAPRFTFPAARQGNTLLESYGTVEFSGPDEATYWTNDTDTQINISTMISDGTLTASPHPWYESNPLGTNPSPHNSTEMNPLECGSTPFDPPGANCYFLIDPPAHGEIIGSVLYAQDKWERQNRTPEDDGSEPVVAVGTDTEDPSVDYFTNRSTATGANESHNGVRWFRGTLTLEVDATDAVSGVDQVQYLRNASGGESVTSIIGSPVDATSTQSPYTKDFETGIGNPVDWESNTVYTVGMEVQDRARNTLGSADEPIDTFDVGIDNRAPDATLHTTPELGPDRDTLVWNITDFGAGVDPSSITVEAETDPDSGNFESVENSTTRTAPDTYEVTHTVDLSTKDDGDYDYRLTVDDNLTQTRTLTEPVSIDSTGPDFLGALNITLENGADYDESDPLQFHDTSEGVHWLKGDRIFYTANVLDNTTSVARLNFTEQPDDPDRRFRQENETETDLWFNRTRNITDVTELGPFELNATAEDTIGNTKESYDDPDSPNVTIGFDRQAPEFALHSSPVELVGTPTFAFNLTDEGSGVNVTNRAFVNLSVSEPGSDSFQEVPWTAENVTSETVRLTWEPSDTLAEGTYAFRVDARDNLTHHVNSPEQEVRLDLVNVTIQETGEIEQREGIPVLLGGNTSRLDQTTFRFVRTADATRVDEVGTSTEWSQTFDFTSDAQENAQEVTVYDADDVTAGDETGDVPLGSYRLEAEITNATGASKTSLLFQGDPIDVSPKLTLDHAPDDFGRQPNGPWLEDGRLNASIWAAFHDTTGTDTSDCSENTCSVSKVVVEGLFSAGDEDEWQEITILDAQAGSTTEPWFNYTFDKKLSNPEDFQDQVRITSNVSLGDDPEDQHETVEEHLVMGPGAGILVPVRPGFDAVNATGNISFAVNLKSIPEETVSSEDAVLELTVRDTVADDEVVTTATMEEPDDGKTGVWTLQTSEIPDEDGPGLNDDNLLDSSRYHATFALVDSSVDPGSSDREVTDTGVSFSVETTDPDISHELAPGAVVEGDRWVGQTLDLNLRIESGFADVARLENVTVAFETGDGWMESPNIEWEVDNMSAARTTDADDEAIYELAGEAETPSAIDHDEIFRLVVNATSNANGTKDDPTQDGKGVETLEGVKLDELPPDPSPNREFSSLLGTFTHNKSLTEDPATFRFNVTDEGSELGNGTAPGTLEVAFLDRTGNETHPAFAPWKDGDWAEPGAEPETFLLEPTGTEDVWVLDNTAETEDLFAALTAPVEEYFVNVTATDRAGNEANVSLLPVAADLGAPTVADDNLTQADDGETFTNESVSVNWGNADEFDPQGGDPGVLTIRARITEDTSLDHVNATLLKPNGDLATVPANLSDGGDCETLDDHTRECTWNATGGNLSHVGTYRLGVAASDGVGNVGGTHNATDGTPFILNFTVQDTIRPSNLTTTFDPAEIGPETNVRARVTGFDDSGIHNASITWVNITGDEPTRHGPFEVTDCEPTDTGQDDPRVAVCTARSDDADLDLFTGDTWTVDWRVRDVADKTRNVSADEFDVLEAGSPIVDQVAPGTDSDFVSPSVGLDLRIEDPSLRDPPADSVLVETRGEEGNFTTYDDWEIEEAASDVHFLNITPPDDDGATWEVRVNVTDAANKSTVNEYTFTIDSGDPDVSLSFAPRVDDGDTTWVAPSTEYTVDASDPSSGVASVEYQVDDGGFQSADGGFTLPDGTSGEVTVTVRATDNAGNADTDSATVTVDDGPPSVAIDDLGRTVTAEVSDSGVGLDPDAVTLLYREGESGDLSESIGMSNTGGSTWEATLSDDVQGQICVVVEAEDQLGNTGRSSARDDPQCFGATNERPTLEVTGPSDGTEVKDEFQVTYEASDPDGDDVIVTFSLLDEDEEDPSPRTLDPVSQSDDQATLDVSEIPDGSYTLTVRASDGTARETAQVSIVIVNQDVVETVKRPSAQIESAEEIELEITVSHPFKTVSGVTAIVERNGETVDEVPMENPEGDTWTLSYTPEEAGSYNISTEVAYDDGSTQTFHVSSFTAAGVADAAGIGAQLVLLVVLGAVVVGMAGYGAFGRWST